MILPGTKNQILLCVAFVLQCSAGPSLGNGKPFTLLSAIDTAVEYNTSLLVANAQIDTRSGNLQVERGFFDPAITAAVSGDTSQDFNIKDVFSISGFQGKRADSAQYGISLNKPLLLGGNIAFDVQMLRDDPFFAGTNITGYQSKIGMRLNLALLRGAGIDYNSAQIRQAEQELKATQNDLVHTISAIVRDVTQAYWRYLAAARTLVIQQNAVQRSQRQLDETQRLVDKDERPAADLEQIKALLATRKADFAAVEQAQQRAQQDLGVLLGIPFDQFNTLTQPADDFPETDLNYMTAEPKLVDLAKDMRWDLQALHDRVEGSKILLDAAQNGMLPRLDLSLFTGYRGLDITGSERAAVTAYGERIAGPDISVGLNYEWNINRNKARGTILSANAIFQQGLYQQDFLSRTISSEVSLAWNSLNRAKSQLNYAKAAMENLRLAVDNEQKKLSRGMATVLDTIVLENQLIDAEKRYVLAHEQFADSVVELRFQSGLIIEQATDTVQVDRRAVTTPPTINSR